MKRSLVRNKPATGKTILRLTIPLVVISIFLINACSKPAGTIGVDIQPEDSKLNLKYSDTSTVFAYSKPIVSVYATNLTWNGIGSLKDPVFGVTNVGFYTNLLLSSSEKDFGPGKTLDSLVLQLRYYGVFADTNTVLTAHVYELQEQIDPTDTSFSNLQLQVYPNDYGNVSFVARPNDSIIIGETDTIPPSLRLNLSKYNPALGEKLLAMEPGMMEDDSIFWTNFAGLYVIAEPVSSDGCIAEFSLTSAYSYLTLYYHNDTASSLSYGYYIGNFATRIAKYEHDFSNADPEFKQQVLEGDTIPGNKNFYLQGLGGVEATVKLPFINKWRKIGNIAVNEAKLVFNVSESEPYLGTPEQLFLYNLDKEGKIEYLIDYYSEGGTFFGGDYNSSSNSYTFRITRYIQSIISDTTLEHYGFSLRISSPSTTPNRLILNGQNQQSDTTAALKLQIIYTDLN